MSTSTEMGSRVKAKTINFVFIAHLARQFLLWAPLFQRISVGKTAEDVQLLCH